MNARADHLHPLPDASLLALLQRAAVAWALPAWGDSLATQAAGAPGWLPPARPRYAVGAPAPVAERVAQRLQLPDWLLAAWRLAAACTLDAELARGLIERHGIAGVRAGDVAALCGQPLSVVLAAWAEHPLRALQLWQPHDAGAPLALQAMQVAPEVGLRVWGLVEPEAPPREASPLAELLRSRHQAVVLHVGATPPPLAERGLRRLAADADLPRQLGRCLLDDLHPLVTLAPDAPPLVLTPDYPGPLLVWSRKPNAPLDPGARSLVVQHAEPEAEIVRSRHWQAALQVDAGSALPWLRHLAASLPLGAEACRAVADDARLAALVEKRPADEALLRRCARQRAALGVQGAVDLRRPQARLADVVLLDAAEQALARALRLHEADLAQGLRLLLAGPPGTGKTLAAEALAHELQRDLLVVDAGRVWSRWLGETERNLETAFEAAETSGALLFIDEADALFARRTEIKDAHDRYANAGTAFLLQRLERFAGVLVLASNARGSLDPAFTRRFDAVVPFDEPDEAGRMRLWARHLDATRSAPLDVPEAAALLARWYPLTGAQIRAASRAALAETGPGGLDAVLTAIAREFHKLGRAFPGRPQPELPSCPR
jgi:hypothetical protein